MPAILGIDEAGRGCIIGPLVIAGVLADEETIKMFTHLGVTDSKKLTDVQRRTLYNSITKLSKKYLSIEIPPEEIDLAVRGRDGLNLNWLESVKAADIINALQPEVAIIDCPSPNITAYKNHLSARLTTTPKLVVQHKADSEHVIVGAASIIAKVLRDTRIEELKKKVGIDFGSGYLSDEKTVTFLKQYWNTHQELFRKSWKPYKDEQTAISQKNLDQW